MSHTPTSGVRCAAPRWRGPQPPPHRSYDRSLVGPGSTVAEQRGESTQGRHERQKANLHSGPSSVDVADKSGRPELTK